MTAQELLQAGRLVEAEAAAQAVLARSPEDAGALGVLGLIALRGGRLDESARLLERACETAPSNPLPHHYLGRLHEARGDAAAAVAAHRRALRLDPDLFIVRLHLGAALERAGERKDAAVQYARALHDAQARGRWLNAATTAPALQPLVENAVQCVRQIRRSLLEDLIAPLRRTYGATEMARVEQSVRIYLNEVVETSPDARQQPTFLYFPGLPPAPYIERSLLPWVGEMEAQTDAIRGELLALLDVGKAERVFTSDELERQNLRGAAQPPSWNGYYFYRHGARREDNCAACPRTASAIEALPLSHVRDHGPEVLFSVFTAGTHLLPHRGVTNTRLVGHLPLIVPKSCALKVADEVHEWREGRVVVFDDTYEHEAWNRSEKLRVVLIFDIWNPHLTPPEREAVASVVAAIGDFRQSVEAA